MAIKLDTQMAGDVFKTELENALDKRGDTMEDGATLTLGKDPENDMDATTKRYADNLIKFTPGDRVICSSTGQFVCNKTYEVGILHKIPIIELNFGTSGNIKLSLSSPGIIKFGSVFSGFSNSNYRLYSYKANIDFKLYYVLDDQDIILYELNNLATEVRTYMNSSNRIKSTIIGQIFDDFSDTSFEIPVERGVPFTIYVDFKINSLECASIYWGDGNFGIEEVEEYYANGFPEDTTYTSVSAGKLTSGINYYYDTGVTRETLIYNNLTFPIKCSIGNPEFTITATT